MTNIDNFNIIEASKSFKKKYGIDLLREEAKILILLEKHGGLSTKNLMSFLNISNRGFYLKIKSLTEEGKIYTEECKTDRRRSEEHTSELQSLMRISYAVFCLKKKK